MSGLTREQLSHLMRIFYRAELTNMPKYKALQDEIVRMQREHVCNFTAGTGPNPPTCRECGRMIVPGDMRDSFRSLAVHQLPPSDDQRGWIPLVMCPQSDLPCVGWDCLERGCIEGRPRQLKQGEPQTNAAPKNEK